MTAPHRSRGDWVQHFVQADHIRANSLEQIGQQGEVRSILGRSPLVNVIRDDLHDSRLLSGNPLDDISSYFLQPPVIQPCRSRLRMPGQILNILQRNPLRQEVGDRRHAE